MRLQTALPLVPRTLSTCATLAALIGGLAIGQARAEKLTIGSPAPSIDVEHWFHDSEPVSTFERGKVYLVEFWATWCGPCVASMPLLAAIQQKYPDDLVVISISGEEPEKIEEFLDRKKGDETYREITSAYRLATDPDGSVSNDYMRAAGKGGIPTAFLVGKTGEIEWIGHPMRMDDPVAKVIAGQWDRAAHLAELEEERLVRARIQHLGRLIQEKKFAEALAELDAATVYAKSDQLRARLKQERRSIEMRAAVHHRREAEKAGTAIEDEIKTVTGLLDAAFLLDAGKRDEAAAKLESLAEEAKTPQIQAMLRQAVMTLKQKNEPAAEVE
ncbi:MAG: TlpA family protein disulfide reductase [Planctomycetia bacterium]